MTIWKNKKNNRLYLIYERYGRCTGFGGYEAEPYSWWGKPILNAKLKNFEPVGKR